jgi:hypothetical protein
MKPTVVSATVSLFTFLFFVGIPGGTRAVLAWNECSYAFTKGAGSAKFAWCVSQHGNVNTLETPAGVQYVSGGGEGYVICSDNTFPSHGYDAGSFELGWEPAVLVDNSPLTIRRDSTDGWIRLTQVFTQSTTQGEIQIKMTVQNLTGIALGGVVVQRYGH